MIPFDFEYLRPESLEEAWGSYTLMQKNGLNPMYYGGGTEIVTYCRTHNIHPEALIDLKHVPECLELHETDQDLVLGAALSLNTIIEHNSFPLLSQVAQAIADHSVRNRLTLGGNMAGRIPYREVVLPLLLAEATVQLAGPAGTRTAPMQEVFNRRLLCEDGEFLVRIRVPKTIVSAPTFYRRKTKNSRVDYPIASATFLKNAGQLRMAVGGAYGFPIRSTEAEVVLNDSKIPLVDRPAKVLEVIPEKIRHDHRASAEYRTMLLERMIKEALELL